MADRNAERKRIIEESRRKDRVARLGRIADKHGVTGCPTPGRCEACR